LIAYAWLVCNKNWRPNVNEIVHVTPDMAREIAALSTEELRAELAQGLRLTAQYLLRLALIVRTLEERGEDLSELRVGLIGYLRKIAYGQVLPEVVVRFAEYPLLIRRISALPLPEQQRLAEGEPIKVFLRRDDGEIDHRLADPLKLTSGQVIQVFAADHVRDQQEQLLLLEDRRNRPAKKQGRVSSRVRADRERGGILVGRAFVAAADALAALADLHPEIGPLDGEDGPTVPVRLSTEVHHRLKVLAAQQGRSMGELIRWAMRAVGLLGQ
jgi:hypothetical protein